MTGLDLAEGFYVDLVAPLLAQHAPDLAYSAALVGPGSEVLGYDDEVSTDHHWGPRVLVFTAERDASVYGPTLRAMFAERLPYEYRGYPTSYTDPDPEDNGTQLLRAVDSGPVNHRVEIVGLRRWLADYLGLEFGAAPGALQRSEPSGALDAIDWLTLPGQKLRSIVAGKVFHDGLDERESPLGVRDRAAADAPGGGFGALSALRCALAWYPDDVWRYLIASVWQRIGQEEHLAGRAGQIGDELGARMIAMRLVRDMMRFCFLAERQYAPYPKWFGRAFADLQASSRMGPLLAAIAAAPDWQERDVALGAAYAEIACIHNALGITRTMPATPRQFFGRPFTVLAIEGYAAATLETIDAEWLSPTLLQSPIGGIDLITDNTDLLEDPAFRAGIRRLLRSE